MRESGHDREAVFPMELPHGAGEVFDWHMRAGAFERLSPPWKRVEVLEREGTIRPGDRVVLRMRVGPLWFRWVARHGDWEEGRLFTDELEEGKLFARWYHRHRIEDLGTGGDGARCGMIDEVWWRLPWAPLSHWVAGGHVARDLERVFHYRQRVLRDDLALHARFAERRRRRVLIAGSTGLVGSALTALLTTGGHEVTRLVRRRKAGCADAQVVWDPAKGELEAGALEGFDAVVHLGGESIASGRWNEARKRRIRDSRVGSTRLLAETLAGLERPPRVFLVASGVGFYGDRGDEVLTEESAAGAGFLPEVCREWEAAARGASDAARDAKRGAGMRVVHARTGVGAVAGGRGAEGDAAGVSRGGGGAAGGWAAVDELDFVG